ncbi:thioredoxin-related transmembrane protein 2 isoform X3 [Panicum virgatum]|uniref:thioredoxin-related transmembrane protein 2 isoform X3 n=1 Tax=Panicum virgatum TaxID=38727 RepID=UPI0019D615E9|nr:thioredoxin-related transmembrane protein 2 isoform X3 [Panicum virgatum]
MEVATATEASAPAASGSAARQNHSFPWLDAAISEPYYFLHLLAFFSYFAARSAAIAADDGGELYHRLLRREIQAVLVFLVLFVVKIVREETWETFIADSLLYAKGLLLAVTLVIDYWLALGYFLGFVGHSNHLTPLQLESLLTEEPTSRFWLVEFRTLFSATCIQASSVLPELSNIYSNKNISFGIIDLGHFPNAAAKFGISMWDHLPTYILFDKATEVARFPEVTSESKVFVPKVTKKLLCQHFDLDRRLIEYLST